MNHAAPADDELARGVVAGDEACLAAAYDRWSAQVHAVARRSLGDPKEAEDVTQLVFLGVWRGRHGYRPQLGTFPGWIMGIARHRIADAHAARTRRTPPPGLAAPAGPPGPEAVLDRLLVRAELARLPPDQRRVLDLAYYEGLSQRQIAERTGWPLGTVKSHTRRGLRRLRHGLGGA
ncbi:RNA polymerase sigma factor [Streptomyces roseirectus]|nr:sigma-70 family RNA polymerase sigma factor [Streptomyces roseirectus]